MSGAFRSFLAFWIGGANTVRVIPAIPSIVKDEISLDLGVTEISLPLGVTEAYLSLGKIEI